MKSYEELAGKFEWTESGLILLANIQREIAEAGGHEKMLAITIEQNCYVPMVKRVTYGRKKTWEPEETEFLYQNWHKLKMVELREKLNCSSDTIRHHALKVLNLPLKNTYAA